MLSQKKQKHHCSDINPLESVGTQTIQTFVRLHRQTMI